MGENIEAVPQDIHVKVQLPTLSKKEDARDVALHSDDAKAMLTYLEKFHYASLEHVTLALLWHTMLRRGSARALDVGDYHPDEQFLAIVHRPQSGTQLKNGEEGERLTAVSGSIRDLLDDWIENRRPEVQDESGREPLLASTQGRIHPLQFKSTRIRSLVVLTYA